MYCSKANPSSKTERIKIEIVPQICHLFTRQMAPQRFLDNKIKFGPVRHSWDGPPVHKPGPAASWLCSFIGSFLGSFRSLYRRRSVQNAGRQIIDEPAPWWHDCASGSFKNPLGLTMHAPPVPAACCVHLKHRSIPSSCSSLASQQRMEMSSPSTSGAI